MSSITDTLRVHGRVHVQVWRVREGSPILQQAWVTRNLITTAGKSVIAGRLGLNTVPAVGWLGIGTGTAVPQVTDVLLQAEIFRTALSTVVVTAPGVLTTTCFLNTSSANGQILREVGLFNVVAANTPTLVARALLSPSITKTITLAVTFTWTITIG